MAREITGIKVKVKSGDKEIETSIPWSTRTASISVDDDTSPRGVLDMIEEMVEQLNKIK
jgi:hypothetical protein